MARKIELYVRNQVIKELIKEKVISISADFYMLVNRGKLELPKTKYFKISTRADGKVREDVLYSRDQLDEIAQKVRDLKTK